MCVPWRVWRLELSAAVSACAVVAGAGNIREGPVQWHSQYGQDRFIYDRFFATDVADARAAGRAPPGGTFVELGAADGIHLSNTLTFERYFGWSGVLIEASNEQFERLERNRPGSTCVHECVARIAGEYEFQEDGLTSGFTDTRILSDAGADVRQCRTLTDILEANLGPEAHVDYLSLDVEGAELDILLSLDLRRFPVDVLSVEMTGFLELHRRERLLRFFAEHDYIFVDRLVDDEIYVRRRGFAADPSCFFPRVKIQGPQPASGGHLGWARARERLWELWRQVNSWTVLGEDALIPQLDEFLQNGSLNDLQIMWETESAAELDAQCPYGMLAMGPAMNLFNNRKTNLPLDGPGVTYELRRQGVFHPTRRLDELGKGFGSAFQDAITEFEREGQQFEVRMPLGRPWHETRFLDAIKSGWPVFGFLDLACRLVTSGGFLYDKTVIDEREYMLPVRTPRFPCALELHDRGKHARLTVRRVRGRGSRAASSDLVFDSDTCGLLGVAAAHFHAARYEILDQRRLASAALGSASGDGSWDSLANWTVGCRLQPGEGPVQGRRARCEGSPSCSALDERSRFVPQRCLRLRQAPGKSLRLRSSKLFQGQAGRTAAEHIEHGERLLKEYVRRYGLFPALWAGVVMPRSPAEEVLDGDSPDPGRFGLPGREGVFAVLHAIQRVVLADELGTDPAMT